MRTAAVILLILAPSIAGADSLEQVKDERLASVLTYMQQLAINDSMPDRVPLRIVSAPTELGECNGNITSCPDVELYIAVAGSALYEPPRLYKLPNAKGWKFDGWLQPDPSEDHGGLLGVKLETTLPPGDIDAKERKSWRSVVYEVWVDSEGARVVIQR